MTKSSSSNSRPAGNYMARGGSSSSSADRPDRPDTVHPMSAQWMSDLDDRLTRFEGKLDRLLVAKLVHSTTPQQACTGEAPFTGEVEEVVPQAPPQTVALQTPVQAEPQENPDESETSEPTTPMPDTVGHESPDDTKDTDKFTHRQSQVQAVDLHCTAGIKGLQREVGRKEATKKNKYPMKCSPSDILESSRFDNLVGLIIIINALTIGYQTDLKARSGLEQMPVELEIVDTIFMILFTMELLLRLYVHRCNFFFMDGWKWNWFDFLVVVAQLAEELLKLIVSLLGGGGSNSQHAKSFKVMRVLRILRLMRILRVMRVLRLISELRTIVSSIIGSMKSLGWTIVLLFLMIYIFGVFFTQSITDVLLDRSESGDISDAPPLTAGLTILRFYFGEMPRALLSLYEVMSGGIDWDTLADPLVKEIGLLAGFTFVAYIAFALLALMNVVTGVFVQTALLSARKEEDTFLTDTVIMLFGMGADYQNADAKLNWEDIKLVLSNPCAANEWKAIDVQPADAQYLFQLLDYEETGYVNFEEFLSGCLRLHGQAKALDLLTVMQEIRTLNKKHLKFETCVRDSLENVLMHNEQVDLLLRSIAARNLDGGCDVVQQQPDVTSSTTSSPNGYKRGPSEDSSRLEDAGADSVPDEHEIEINLIGEI